MTPLVDEEGWRLGVGRLDPGWEQATFIRLEEQELVEVLMKGVSTIFGATWMITYGVRDLLHRLNVVARDELVIGVEELNACLLERALGEQETLDARQALVRVVVRLLDQCKLFALRLVETAFHRVRFFQLLQSENE